MPASVLERWTCARGGGGGGGRLPGSRDVHVVARGGQQVREHAMRQGVDRHQRLAVPPSLPNTDLRLVPGAMALDIMEMVLIVFLNCAAPQKRPRHRGKPSEISDFRPKTIEKTNQKPQKSIEIARKLMEIQRFSSRSMPQSLSCSVAFGVQTSTMGVNSEPSLS